MRALVTGGAGLIGSHLAEHLIARGDEVVILDDLSTGRLENIEGISASGGVRLIEGSVCDPDAVRRAVRGCEQVFHLAAAVGVGMIVERPLHTLLTNVNGTENVLRAATSEGAATLVVSSSEVYGRSARIPYAEDSELVLGPPTISRWGYACSKLHDEFLAFAFAREHGAKVVIARIFNTVGPRQIGRYGMVVPRMVAQAREGGPIEVHGDGQQRRCFAYAGDTARTLMRLLSTPGAYSEVFNVGNDDELRVIDLAERVRERFSPRCAVRFVPYHEAYGPGFEDLPRRVPDLRKLRALLGVTPALRIDEILALFE